jgi:hypothetical protein
VTASPLWKVYPGLSRIFHTLLSVVVIDAACASTGFASSPYRTSGVNND